MSKRRISSDLFDVFPSSFLKKTKQNEVISPIQQEKDPFFQTQDIIRHPMPLNSKLIMTKMAFPSSSTFLKPEAFIKTNKEDDIMNSLFNINEYNDKSSFFYKDNQNNDKNSLSNFNYNPQNIPNFESFLQQSPPVPPLTVNLHAYFSFPYFNKVQTKCLFPLLFSNENMVISAPTGSGKTVLFEIAILKQYLENPPKTSKTIYLSPIKALCQEKNQEWAEKFSPFGLSLLELTGDSGEIEEQEAFHKSSIIITTPEKWDSITRKWHGNELLLSQVTLILIDEVHLLNTEERGATLEAVISRMKLISSRKQAKKLRIIALSATIPNIEDIAAWLEVPPLGVRRFGEEYRPVALEKHVLGYNRSKSEFLFEKSLNYRLLEIIRRYAEKKPVLVFCQTQKGTMAACEQLIVDGHEREFVNSDEHLKVLVEQGSRVGDPQLKKFILAGVAFHNARLKPEDRRVVEGLFKERLIF